VVLDYIYVGKYSTILVGSTSNINIWKKRGSKSYKRNFQIW